MSLRYWVLVLALVLTGLSSDPARCAVYPRFDLDNPACVEAGTDNYTLRVCRDPYRLELLRAGQVIAAGEAGGSAFVRSGSRHALTRVVGAFATGESLFLRVECEGGLEASLRLTFFSDNVLVSLTPPAGPDCARIEETFSLAASGHWYGGKVTDGHNWPLENAELDVDPFPADGNQTSPIWLTSNGAGFFVPSGDPMGFTLNKGGDGKFRFNVKERSVLEYRLLAGRDIVEAYDSFTALAGRPSTVPPRGYFAYPVFNTWIEFQKDQRQDKILAYARTLREHKFGCEVLMIDDMWQSQYGDHAFDKQKFGDPQAMLNELHKLGFKVVLWEVPFVDRTASSYKFLAGRKWLVRDRSGKVGLSEWWDGTSALVDLSNPEAYAWFVGELKNLQSRYGVDGFKLDAADANYFLPGFSTWGAVTANRYTDLYASVGAHFEINELRVSWLAQGMGLVQRLRDKNSNWSRENGVGSLVPHGLTESLLGYGYFCPDMIGGGLDSDFGQDRFSGMDPEMFIRWTQASALMPMMQFSYAPWHLDPESEKICLKYTRLHEQLGDYIYSLAQEMQRTGRPIIRPLFFAAPGDEKAYLAREEFMLGERFLVAPVVEKGATAREVYLPAGLWKDFWSGEIYNGGSTLAQYPAPLDKLPIFVRLD